ncbi:hypothetical protein BDP81DRAFT_350037 [Colletotrichum phormii]|uniref:Transmembrane protein n=1 Tax=Colletotrichum phormii TaxID=359342 RepID=A0AAJ0EET6_9PEZI|nr:uncharacterized protein BDP81DRAFT_350037 [Colletotrichum phormii]KAK1636203.1 hypothetical protein BDP81DRAFT_350037 [Colletotrichum phormii]
MPLRMGRRETSDRLSRHYRDMRILAGVAMFFFWHFGLHMGFMVPRRLVGTTSVYEKSSTGREEGFEMKADN